ncbi:signal peptidase II [Pacificimonas sp. WHA3]|uniref:Lipoprotein signal peptidase n=1 Tax=Pacificimonas pallii TaxID=2827236 RepID=A0ABS6SHA0_9SPHN|nr:signal peptidase II [Pacificimonas pallii]MBV7257625.1 signal peptidase II [Pacificimonas pallii]
MTRTLAYVIAGIVLLLDQLTKWLMVSVIELERLGSIPLIPSLNLTWVENRGVAMGLLDAGGSDISRWLLVVLTAGISAAVIWWINSERDRADLFAMSLILGGAIGNIIDRVRLGYVIDFVHFYVAEWSFYVFNVADAAISIGVGLLLLRAFFGKDAHAKKEEEHA